MPASPNEHTRGPGRAATRSLQPIDTPRKPPKSFVPREVRDSVIAQIRIHDEGPLAVARRTGLTLRETVHVVIEEMENEKRAEFQRGYRTGLSRTMPPPPAGARRAA